MREWRSWIETSREGPGIGAEATFQFLVSEEAWAPRGKGPFPCT
jgi:hypothetical protein